MARTQSRSIPSVSLQKILNLTRAHFARLSGRRLRGDLFPRTAAELPEPKAQKIAAPTSRAGLCRARCKNLWRGSFMAFPGFPRAGAEYHAIAPPAAPLGQADRCRRCPLLGLSGHLATTASVGDDPM